MVFDGEHLDTLDTQLLSRLKQSQAKGEAVGFDPYAAASSAGPRGRRPGSAPVRGRWVAVMAGFAVVVLIASGLAIANRQGPGHHGAARVADAGDVRAKAVVTAAISRTLGTNHFDFDYRLAETPPKRQLSPPATDCQTWPAGSTPQVRDPATGKFAPVSTTSLPDGRSKTCYPLTEVHSIITTGHGSMDVEPKSLTVFANIASAEVPKTDDNMQLVVDGDQLRYTDPEGRLSDPMLLSGFEPFAKPNLGPREGAVAMTQLASPAGYLDLEAEAVTSASPVGSGTVGGVAVTNYDVTVDLSNLSGLAGLTADDQTAIRTALGELRQEGFTGLDVRVSIDGAGLIRQVHAVDQFADAGQVIYDATYRY